MTVTSGKTATYPMRPRAHNRVISPLPAADNLASKTFLIRMLYSLTLPPSCQQLSNIQGPPNKIMSIIPAPPFPKGSVCYLSTCSLDCRITVRNFLYSKIQSRMSNICLVNTCFLVVLNIKNVIHFHY